MLENETLWDAAARCDRVLNEAGIPYSVCGGVAVCLHGYRRNTVNLDLAVRAQDTERVRQTLVEAGLAWCDEAKEFRTEANVAVHFLIAGQPAGRGQQVKAPTPIGDDNVEQIEGLTVLRLSRLIEMKIASALGNPRRTHKGLADVVELIVIRKLDVKFAGLLDKAVRAEFRELLQRVRHGE